MDTIYLIKARVQITSNQPYVSYKPLSVNGLFIPKTKTRKHSYVEEKCREYLLSNLQNEQPELNFKVTSVKIESFKSGFILNEK
ncbi:hypothetical protein [Labilibaculum euxinus]